MPYKRKKLLDFLQEPFEFSASSQWVWHGTLELYVRKPYSPRQGWDICIANVQQHGRMGQGEFYELLDMLEPNYTIKMENVLNDSLNMSLRLNRGYTQSPGGGLSLIRRKGI